MLANELHRRLTFRAEERVGWLAGPDRGGLGLAVRAGRDQRRSGLAGRGGRVRPPALQIALVIAVTAVIGLLRFIALRWIFRPTSARPPGRRPRDAGTRSVA